MIIADKSAAIVASAAVGLLIQLGEKSTRDGSQTADRTVI
jgi:hypothetical protein